MDGDRFGKSVNPALASFCESNDISRDVGRGHVREEAYKKEVTGRIGPRPKFESSGRMLEFAAEMCNEVEGHLEERRTSNSAWVEASLCVDISFEFSLHL